MQISVSKSHVLQVRTMCVCFQWLESPDAPHTATESARARVQQAVRKQCVWATLLLHSIIYAVVGDGGPVGAVQGLSPLSASECHVFRHEPPRRARVLLQGVQQHTAECYLQQRRDEQRRDPGRAFSSLSNCLAGELSTCCAGAPSTGSS